MSQEKNDPNSKSEKRLLNEILPDPERAATELASGGPRRRAAEHLRRILAASLVGPFAAGTMAHGSQAAQNPPPPPSPPPFRVVDSLPPPPQPPKPGYLSIKSDPVADIAIDGKATGLKTPQLIELKPGNHTIKLSAGDLQDSFTIVVESDKTRSEERKLEKPADPKEKEPK